MILFFVGLICGAILGAMLTALISAGGDNFDEYR